MKQPNDLEEAITFLLEAQDEESLEFIKSVDEEEFCARAHHTTGRYLRNSWHLWWNEEMAKQYPHTMPSKKPNLVEFFNNLGITHADDMSGIIITSTYRQVHNVPRDLDIQVQKYKDYWKNYKY